MPVSNTTSAEEYRPAVTQKAALAEASVTNEGMGRPEAREKLRDLQRQARSWQREAQGSKADQHHPPALICGGSAETGLCNSMAGRSDKRLALRSKPCGASRPHHHVSTGRALATDFAALAQLLYLSIFPQPRPFHW
jgi:hypothetical protein